jgi:hypothetical protein
MTWAGYNNHGVVSSIGTGGTDFQSVGSALDGMEFRPTVEAEP